MAGEFEARGEEFFEIARAALDVVGAAAGFAVEVVVVLESGGLVEGGLARELDLDDVALVEHDGECAVDRGEAHVGDAAAAFFEDLMGAERAGGVREDLADGGTLSGVSRV